MNSNYTIPSGEEDLEPYDAYQLSLFTNKFSIIACYLKVVLCILVGTTTLLVIYPILNFKKLHTRTNYILLNFFIVTLAFNIIKIVENTLAALEYPLKNIPFMLFMAISLSLLLQIAFILAALLSIDSFIVLHFKNFSTTYQRIYKWVIGLSYAFPLLYVIPSFIAGYHYLIAIDFFFFVIYWIGFIIILIINVIVKVNGKTYNEDSLKSSYILTLSNIYYLMWLPAVVMSMVVYNLSSAGTPSILAVVVMSHCFRIISLVSPIVMTCVLVRRDKNFKMSYDYIFKRSGNSYLSANNADGANII